MYTGKFKDINDIDYTIEITNSNTTGDTQIKLGTPAFVTSLESDSDNIYKPVKCSNATLRIISNDYKFDLYSSNAQQNKVILKKENKVVWCGFISPNLYNQGYEMDEEQFDIECQDALSILQYMDYKEIITGKKSIVRFITLIGNILQKCGCYTTFHISNSIKIKPTDNYCLAHYCYISESNFFDKENKPMKYKEVLEEICKFLNLTCIAVGNEVFFVSYDEIKTGAQSYSTYTVGSSQSTPTITNINEAIEISQPLYKSNGSTLSLDKVYNKVSVLAKHNVTNDLMPNIFEEKYLKQLLTAGEEYKLEDDIVYLADKEKEGYRVKYQWFKHTLYQQFFYDRQTQQPTQITYPFNVGFPISNIGAYIVKHSTESIDKKPEKNVFKQADSSLSLSTYLLLAHHNYLRKQLPLFKMKLNNMPNCMISNDSDLVLSGNVKLYLNEIKTDRPLTACVKELTDRGGGKVIDCTHNLTLPMILKMGNKYYNSINKNWQDEECVANIPLTNDNIDKTDTLQGVIDVDLTIKNTINWYENKDNESNSGYEIPMPTHIMTDVTDLEITFMTYDKEFVELTPFNVSVDYAFISDFKAEIKRRTKRTKEEDVERPLFELENKEENNETDTLYENVIDSNFVEEKDEITFNICTDDGKKNAYSSVLYNDGSGLKLLDTTVDSSTKQANIRQEEQLIYRLVNQYKQPAIRLQSTLNTQITPLTQVTDIAMFGKSFVVDSTEVDYEYDSQQITIVEKL